jgi:hypothetical protein
MPRSRPSVRQRRARRPEHVAPARGCRTTPSARGALLTELGVRRCRGAVFCIFQGQRHPGRLARSRSVSLGLKRMAWAPHEAWPCLCRIVIRSSWHAPSACHRRVHVNCHGKNCMFSAQRGHVQIYIFFLTGAMFRFTANFHL